MIHALQFYMLEDVELTSVDNVICALAVGYRDGLMVLLVVEGMDLHELPLVEEGLFSSGPLDGNSTHHQLLHKFSSCAGMDKA